MKLKKEYNTMKNKMTIFTSALLLTVSAFAMSSMAFAEKSSIEVQSQAFKVIETINEKGKKVITHVKTDEASIIPKDKVIYITTVTNIGKEPAENIVVTNPIPKQLTYVSGSAEGKATEISFSVNQGKTFHDPKNIFVKTKTGKQRLAEAKDYNALQWVYLPKLKAGQKTTMSFEAILGQER